MKQEKSPWLKLTGYGMEMLSMDWLRWDWGETMCDGVSSENADVNGDEALRLKQELKDSLLRCVEGCCWLMMRVIRPSRTYRGLFIHDLDRILYCPNTTPWQSFQPGPACLSTSPSSSSSFYSSQQTKCILCAFFTKTYMILITSLA